ncbi:ead/Ea22-like family protein [Serratia proteamaculans]|uniref:ead/Ea22-like family protein n=1 Tax=Serratia proteamaculans TaxID=28151 RepID=UPI003D086D52
MMDNKLSELKAAAMAATPGPWILDDDSWSEGDNANVSTEERYDGRIVSIAQIEGGGSESGFDEPFSSEQQANARYITAANPAVVLELLAERDADKKRIAELEAIRAAAEKLVRCKGRYHSEQNYRALAALFGVTAPDLPPVDGDSEAVIAELRAKLATPVQLQNCDFESVAILAHWCTDEQLKAWVKGVEHAKKQIRAAGFKVEGDE